MWKGLHYYFFDERTGQFKIPGQDKLTDKELDMMPRYQHVTNLYQAFGLTLISVLTEGNPRTKWMPADPENHSDVATSKAATDVAQLFRRNNPIPKLLQDIMFYLFNDGGCAGFVRYVADEQKYGVDETPRTELQTKPGDPVATCTDCGVSGPVPAPDPGQTQPTCPECGTPLDPSTMREGEPVTFTAPAMDPTTGQQMIDRTPRGQEMLELVSFLNLVLPTYAQEQDQYPFLTYSGYFHKARVIATYPWIEKRIDKSGDSGSGGGEAASAQAYEKSTNIALLESGTGPARAGGKLGQVLLPLRRTWFRPWAFYAVKDETIRAELLRRFPKGVKVTFCGDTYCEAEEDEMDKRWKVVHAFPGEGQNREAVGSSLIPVQKQYNALSNILYETAEYGIPALFVNSDTLDIAAFREAGSIPGLVFGAMPSEGGSLPGDFFQTQPATLSQFIPEYLRELRSEIGQFLVGAFPAIFGGDTGGNDTAAGIADQRDQGLGRIGLLWRTMVGFLADIDGMAVECFKENRPADVKIAVMGPAGTLDSKLIRLDELKGNIRAYPDVTEAYPVTFEKRRQAVEAASANPAFAALFARPSNAETFFKYSGMADEIEIPGASERESELRVISRAIQEGPAGMPPVDPMMDDAQVIAATIREWAASDAGQETRQTRPDVWMALRMRLDECATILQAQQATAVPPETPGGAPGDDQTAPPVQ